MSEQLASLHGKGVSIKRTTLWTNPSPSATFAAQSITLSDDMSNYDEIEIKGKRHLVPAVEEFIAAIDFDKRFIKFVLPDGLIE